MTARKTISRTAWLAFALLVSSGFAQAQSGGQQSPPPAQQPPAQQPPAQQQDKKPNVQDLTLDAPAPPTSAEEDGAYKAYADELDTKKKIQLGEAFMQKYPQSRYRSPLYASMTVAYVQDGNVPKMEEVGDKEVALNPNDGQTLAMLGQTIPRSFNPSAPDAQQKLDKAEKYSKRALEVVPMMPKPEAITDEQFTRAKNQALAMAHSGLGLVFVRRGKFAEAIPDLEQSVKLDPQPDPVNYYLLGLANEKTSHFDDAATAFTKCAGLQSSLSGTCKSLSEEAKKLGASQLSAPK